MPISVQSHEGASKQVKLNCELSGKRAIDKGEVLMGCQKVFAVILEVIDGKQLCLGNPLEPLESKVLLFVNVEVEL